MDAARDDVDDIELNIGGNCPVSGEGSWMGRYVYFRARGSSWGLSVDLPEDDPENIPDSVRALPQHVARGKLGNSGWVDRYLANEIVRLHLWCWDLKEQGVEESGGAQGALFKALRTLNPQEVVRALEAGANPRRPLAPGGPLPLAVTLGMFCEEGEEPASKDAEIRDSRAMMMAMIESSTVVHDDGRDARRHECVKQLLNYGADPSGTAQGWRLDPIHWAAMLPVGAVDPLNGGIFSSMPDESAQIREKSWAAERGRQELNPTGMLMAAGADFMKSFDEPSGEGMSALQIMLAADGVDAAQRLGEPLGEAAMLPIIAARVWTLSRGTFSRNSLSPSEKEKALMESVDMRQLLDGFVSGRWPASWLAKILESGRESYAEVVAIIEAACLAGAAPQNRSGASSRVPPRI